MKQCTYVYSVALYFKYSSFRSRQGLGKPEYLKMCCFTGDLQAFFKNECNYCQKQIIIMVEHKKCDLFVHKNHSAGMKMKLKGRVRLYSCYIIFTFLNFTGPYSEM